MDMPRLQFRLRTLLLLTLLASMVFGLVAARYSTVRRFDEIHRLVDELSGKVAWQSTRLVSQRGTSAPGFGQPGFLSNWYSDEMTFDIAIDVRESRFLYGEPIVEIVWTKSVGSLQIDSQRSQQLCAEIKELFPKDTRVTINMLEHREWSLSGGMREANR